MQLQYSLSLLTDSEWMVNGLNRIAAGFGGKEGEELVRRGFCTLRTILCAPAWCYRRRRRSVESFLKI